MAEVALITIAVLLVLFGAVFAWSGMSSERSYWSQRDPEGNARREATSFSTVVRSAPRLAVSEQRAPLRIAAIGVLLIGIGIVAAIAALLFWLL